MTILCSRCLKEKECKYSIMIMNLKKEHGTCVNDFEICDNCYADFEKFMEECISGIPVYHTNKP